MTTTLTARGPEDLLAIVPVVLGFRPTDSLVMLTFGAAHSFHARLDLPPPEELGGSLPALVESLLAPALAHGVRQVALLSYSDDVDTSARVAQALDEAFADIGIEVVALLRAHEGRWCHLPPIPGETESEPTAYDATNHPFAVHAVLEGLVTHGSREELRSTIAASPAAVERVLEVQEQDGFQPADEAWALDLVDRCVAEGRPPEDVEAARVLAAVTRPELRDAVLFAVTRGLAMRQLQVWVDLLRRAPDAQVPDTAAVTAFYAWQAGHGALAWCALDRCLEVDPRHRLGYHLAQCLTRAVPPSAWGEAAGRWGAGPRTRHHRGRVRGRPDP